MSKPLKVKIENLTLNINVGTGLNDWAWLASCAAKIYGKKQYPPGNYLPSFLKV